MSAGQQKQHYIQDACELYFVAAVQKILENKDYCITHDSLNKSNDYFSYVTQRNVLDEFLSSQYKGNIDKIIDSWVEKVYQSAGKKFDISCNEIQSRAVGKKSDFCLTFEDGSIVDFSLKNYKNGIRRNMQVCSGTWVSFLCNIAFDSSGVGKNINPIDKKTFNPGRNKKLRQQAFSYVGLQHFNDLVDSLEDTKNNLKKFYGKDPLAEQWQSISDSWQKDCALYGTNAASLVSDALNHEKTDKDIVKKTIIKMAGLDAQEEMLAIGIDEYLCTFTTTKFKNFVKSINHQDCKLNVFSKNQSLFICFEKGEEQLLKINIPFTLQKNGAWHLPDNEYEGTQYHTKEKINLKYGQRRPKKSKEINTSINTYYSFLEAGVLE